MNDNRLNAKEELENGNRAMLSSNIGPLPLLKPQRHERHEAEAAVAPVARLLVYMCRIEADRTMVRFQLHRGLLFSRIRTSTAFPLPGSGRAASGGGSFI